METLIIEIQKPEARKLIDSMVDLGLISVKTAQSSWKERWKEFSDSLSPSSDISEEEIVKEIAEMRNERAIS